MNTAPPPGLVLSFLLPASFAVVFLILRFILIYLFSLSYAPSPLKSSTLSQPWPGEKASTFLQTTAIFLIYSSSLSFATSCCSLHCSKFFHLPLWVLAGGNLLQPNFDWSTLSSHSRALYSFPFPPCAKLHSSKGIYVAMEIILEATQALFLSVAQQTPTESAEWTGRGETCSLSCCNVASGQTPGQLEWGRKLDRNINSYINIETNAWLCYFWNHHSAQFGKKLPAERHTALFLLRLSCCSSSWTHTL